MAALGLINSNGTGAAALGQIKINLVPKVIVPKGHGEKKKRKAESTNGNRNNKSGKRSKNNYKS